MVDIETIGVEFKTDGLKAGQRELDKTTQAANKTADAADNVGNAAQRSSSQFRALESTLGTLRTVIGSLGVALVAKEFFGMADAVTTLQNQLKLATGSGAAASQAYEQLYEIAQRSRVSFTELGGTYAAIARAGSQLGVSQNRLLTVTEAIGNAMTISGGSAASMQAALVQLSQGLSSGTLRGEELNSVMEQTPRLAQALADGLGVPKGALRELGAAGKLTAEQVIKALESQSGVLANEVKSATLTVGQAFTQLSDATTKFIGEADSAYGVSKAFASGLSAVAGGITDLGKAAREHQVAISTTLGIAAGAGVLATFPALLSGFAALKVAVVGLGVALAANPLVLALLGIGAAVGGFVAYNSAIEKTADGIRRTINELEEMNRTGMRGRGTEEERLAWVEKRNQQIRQLRQELALLDNQGLNTKAEDARLAAYGAQAKAQATAQETLRAKLIGTRDAINGINEKYRDQQAHLETLQQAYAAGMLTETEYLAAVKKVNDALVKQYSDKTKAKTAEQLHTEALKKAIEARGKWLDQNAAYESALEMEAIELEHQNRLISANQTELEKLTQTEYERANALEEEVKKQREANQAIGLSRIQVAQLEAARLQDAAAEKTRWAAIMDGIDPGIAAEYRRQAEAMRLLASERVAGAFGEEMDAQRKNQLAEWNRYWDQVGQALTDALMEGGKSGAEYLKGLFRTLVLRPVILAGVQSGMNALGLGAMGPQAQSSGGGGLSSILPGGSLTGALGSGISSMGGALGSTAIADFGMGMNIGSAALSQMGGVTGAASAGASFAGALPYIGWAIAAISFLKGFDDSGTLHMGGAGAFGASLGAVSGSASQDYTGFGLTSDQYASAANKQATDIAKSLVGILDTTAATFGSSGRYTVGTGYADDSSKDGAWGALRISKGGQTVSDWGMGADKWPGREFSDGEAGRTEYLSAVASEIRTALKAETPAWADVMMDALGDTPTIEDLSAVVQQINAFQKALHGLGVAMPQLAGLADETVTALVNAFGGTESLANSVSAYYQSFYSASEQFSTSQRLLGEQFAALNMKVPESTSSFRALVDSQDLTTAAGRSTYASLMQLAPAFYTVAKAVEDTFNAISSTTAQSVRDIEMSILGDAEKYQYLDREIEGLITKLSTATLPAEIQATFEKINQGTMAAYNLLGADQQKGLATQFIDRLYEAEAIAQSRLSVSGQQSTTEDAQAQTVLENKAAAADSRAAAKEMLDAATVYRQAAETMLAASNKATVVELRLNGQKVAANEVEFG